MEEAKGVYEEIAELADDAGEFAERYNVNDSKSAIKAYIFHILFPQSSGIFISLLSGNIVKCFTTLRLLLESLVMSYFADMKYSDKNFFLEKLMTLEKERDKQKISISKLMKKLGHDYVALWSRLSNDWIHSIGLSRKIIEGMSNGVPAWALGLPMNFGKSDLNALTELKESVSVFRELLKRTIEMNNKDELNVV